MIKCHTATKCLWVLCHSSVSLGLNQILNSDLLSILKVALKKEADEALVDEDKKETAKITEEPKDAPLAKQEV